MIDSTDSGDIVDQCAAWSAELVVEANAGSQAQKTLQDALLDARKGAGAMAFEGEQVLASPKDRFDALTNRGEMQIRAGLVLAARTHDGGTHLTNGTCECATGVALVAQKRLASGAPAPGEQLQPDLAFVTLGRGEGQRSWGPSGAKIACRRNPQKYRECEAHQP